MQSSSPFKFLNSYELKDRDFFFGREEESQKLYELVNQNRLVLLYGRIGTGKTSLVQCGLGKKYNLADWLPIYIRRGSGFPDAIQNSIIKRWPEKMQKKYGNIKQEPCTSLVTMTFNSLLRPIYLIFDQLEEVFIMGDQTEQLELADTIAKLYFVDVPCKIIFVIREEYLAHLYDLEPIIPTLFDRQLRIKSMSPQKTEEVVIKSCLYFNILLENPEKNATKIVNAVKEDSKKNDKSVTKKPEVVLSFLQVYLDRLYRENFVKKYGLDVEFKDYVEKENHLEFKTQDITDLGEINNILGAFLLEQIEQIKKNVNREYENMNVEKDTIYKILNEFVSLDETKIPKSIDEIVIRGLEDWKLKFIIAALEESRILRKENGIYELYHDTLAEEIANQRTSEEIMFMDTVRIVKNTYSRYKLQRKNPQSEKNKLPKLSDIDLSRIKKYQKEIEANQKLDEDEWRFVNQNKERSKRIYFWTRALVFGTMTILFLLSIVAIQQCQQAKDAQFSTNIALENAQEATQKARASRKALDDERISKQQSLIQGAETRLNAAIRLDKRYNNRETAEEKQKLDSIYTDLQNYLDTLLLLRIEHDLEDLQEDLRITNPDSVHTKSSYQKKIDSVKAEYSKLKESLAASPNEPN